MSTPAHPDHVIERFTALLDEAGLAHFSSVRHDLARNELQLVWDTGLIVIIDLTDDGELEPIDASANLDEPIHVTAPGRPGDPREDTSIPGVVIHRTPPLHPDDLTVVNSIPCTSVSRTLIDLAEVMPADELRECFARARALGQLDPEALRASRARVEWRPSLAMLDEVIAEFCA
jgi:hypothetical protein